MSLKISCHGTSLKWSQRPSDQTKISMRIVISYIWNGASRYEFNGKSMETKTTTWSELPNGRKSTVEQILASEEMNKCKRAGLWESQSVIWVGKLTMGLRQSPGRGSSTYLSFESHLLYLKINHFSPSHKRIILLKIISWSLTSIYY